MKAPRLQGRRRVRLQPGAHRVGRPPPAAPPHPWVAVDVVIFTVQDGCLRTLLVKIKHGPCTGRWAFPGGRVGRGESLEAAARRELAEKTALGDVYLEQLFSFGDPARNPRVHVVSTAYFALVANPPTASDPGAKYAEAAWFDVTALPALAYDHDHMARVALERLRAKIEYTNVVYSLLREEFTLGELQRIYEIIRGCSLDRRNFRKRILQSELLRPLAKLRRGAHRPAKLYAFRSRRLQRIELF